MANNWYYTSNTIDSIDVSGTNNGIFGLYNTGNDNNGNNNDIFNIF